MILMKTNNFFYSVKTSPIGQYIVKKLDERKLEEDAIKAVNSFNFKVFALINMIKNEISKETFDDLMYYTNMFSIQLEKNLNINTIDEYNQFTTILDIYKEYLINIFINNNIDEFYATIYNMFGELSREGLMYKYSIFEKCDYNILQYETY